MSARLRPTLFPVLMTTLLASAVANAQIDASMESWPEWVRTGMAEEIRRTKLRQVKMPIETIRAKMPGKPEPAQAIEDGWYFAADIKAGSPLECYRGTMRKLSARPGSPLDRSTTSASLMSTVMR